MTVETVDRLDIMNDVAMIWKTDSNKNRLCGSESPLITQM